MKSYSIKVHLSEEDLHYLQRGESFNWTWTAEEDDNVMINIKLFQAEEGFDEED